MTRRPHAVTIVDVAREAGVSKSSAARVLAGRGSASQATQQRVHAAAQRLGYRPNALAKAMISGSSNTIAVMIPDVASPFFSAVVRGASDAAHAAGFEVLLGNTDNDRDVQARSIEVLREKQVDGFVIAPVFEDEPVSVRSERRTDAARRQRLQLRETDLRVERLRHRHAASKRSIEATRLEFDARQMQRIER